MRWSILNRKMHRWGAVLTAVPVLIIVATGLMLHFKKQVAWIQPPEQTGSGGAPTLTFEEILTACRSVPEAGVDSWEDIDRIDVRPSRGILKVRSKNSWELQLDNQSGEVLHSAHRRSDFIENIHDGSFLGGFGKWFVFLPAAVLLLGLWMTGVYLWFLPWLVRRARK